MKPATSQPPPPAPKGSNDVLVGIALMGLGVSLLPVMNSFAKALALEYPSWQVVCARFVGHVFWISLLFLPSVGLSLFRSRSPRIQLARSSIFFVSNAAFIAALPSVPLATASAIMFITPVLVTLLSIPMLRERVGPWRWGAVLLGFVGALVIIRPGTSVFNVGAALVLLSACCFGVYQILTRRLSTVERPQTQAVYTALVGAGLASLLMPWVGVAPKSMEHIVWFCSVGLVGGIAQFLVIQALQRGPASVISPIGYAELISAVIFGYAVFGEFPDAATWLGAALIVIAGAVIALRERQAENRAHR